MDAARSMQAKEKNKKNRVASMHSRNLRDTKKKVKKKRSIKVKSEERKDLHVMFPTHLVLFFESFNFIAKIFNIFT